MKTNGVPEKIQIHFIKNDYDAWSVRGYSFLEDKQMGMTEYTRTDAFIEKAEKYLTEKFIKDVSVLAGGVASINFDVAISNFVNYMKGE
jgi:hypothetical protein